jgi:hypothetical protein
MQAIAVMATRYPLLNRMKIIDGQVVLYLKVQPAGMWPLTPYRTRTAGAGTRR